MELNFFPLLSTALHRCTLPMMILSQRITRTHHHIGVCQILNASLTSFWLLPNSKHIALVVHCHVKPCRRGTLCSVSLANIATHSWIFHIPCAANWLLRNKRLFCYIRTTSSHFWFWFCPAPAVFEQRFFSSRISWMNLRNETMDFTRVVNCMWTMACLFSFTCCDVRDYYIKLNNKTM